MSSGIPPTGPSEDIEHRTTRVGRPQSNGFIERSTAPFSRSISASRDGRPGYETVEEMRKDLDAYLETYNQRRPHRGRGMQGRTPLAVFEAGIPRKRTPQPPTGKEATKAA